MDPSPIVSLLALLGTVILGGLTLRKDKELGTGTLRSADTDAAIAGLRAAFEEQRQLTEACRGECAELRADLTRALQRIEELEEP